MGQALSERHRVSTALYSVKHQILVGSVIFCDCHLPLSNVGCSFFSLFDSFNIMAEELVGNCLVAQSGGPTAVINASVAGVVTEALNNPCIEEIYGGMNGVLGILKEDLIDLAEESQQNIRGLRYTPASALGTCRFKLKREQDYERVIEVFEAHNIRYFFYAG